jgi:hypothetical protein
MIYDMADFETSSHLQIYLKQPRVSLPKQSQSDLCEIRRHDARTQGRPTEFDMTSYPLYIIIFVSYKAKISLFSQQRPQFTPIYQFTQFTIYFLNLANFSANGIFGPSDFAFFGLLGL